MDDSIQISKINDFIFCPFSQYLHAICESFDPSMYYGVKQTNGKAHHESIDNSKYSSAKRYKQGISVFSKNYGLVGKIDLYDEQQKTLIERKYKVNSIFGGYRYQLYAQMFCMQEAGYTIDHLYIYSLSDNKKYEIDLPDETEINCFKKLLKRIRNYDVNKSEIKVNSTKCDNCIYRNLCDKCLI